MMMKQNEFTKAEFISFKFYVLGFRTKGNRGKTKA